MAGGRGVRKHYFSQKVLPYRDTNVSTNHSELRRCELRKDFGSINADLGIVLEVETKDNTNS